LALASFTGRSSFDPVPAKETLEALQIDVAPVPPDGVNLGLLVSPGGDFPEASPLDW